MPELKTQKADLSVLGNAAFSTRVGEPGMQSVGEGGSIASNRGCEFEPRRKPIGKKESLRTHNIEQGSAGYVNLFLRRSTGEIVVAVNGLRVLRELDTGSGPNKFEIRSSSPYDPKNPDSLDRAVRHIYEEASRLLTPEVERRFNKAYPGLGWLRRHLPGAWRDLFRGPISEL